MAQKKLNPSRHSRGKGFYIHQIIVLSENGQACTYYNFPNRRQTFQGHCTILLLGKWYNYQIMD